MSAPDLSDAAVAGLVRQAVRVIPAERSTLLLLCEHAGNAVPPQWQNLGLAPPLLQTHFAWDAGASALTEALAKRLPAAAVLASYSRLFIDLNRLASDWDCIRPDLAGIPVPANLHLDENERALRERIARVPFDHAVEEWLDERPVVVSIHTFTPIFSGAWREPDIGVLWRKEAGLGPAVLDALRGQAEYVVGDNQPYDWNASDGYTLRRHGLDQGLRCLYLEVRNSLLERPEDVDRVASVLAAALAVAIAI
jgi:predicted N-formylglutamate amidohydrolase